MPSRGLTWGACSEASNNSIASFNYYQWVQITDGLRVLCAPHPHAAAAAAVASGSGSLHSDLRDNKLKEFKLEEFLAKALQLTTLYAAANACALRAHRMIGFMARRLAGGNALYCGADTDNCGPPGGMGDETLTIESRATEMYAPVSDSTAAAHR